MAVDVKICGLTRAADARAARDAGATYLGVIFAGGPRLVSADAAASIVSATMLPVFGVFGTQSISEILAIRDRAGIAGAQLHGTSTAADARALRAEDLLVWRVVRIRDISDLPAVRAAAEEADGVLVEPFVAGLAGGGGASLSPDLAIAARRELAGVRMILAGGLGPANASATAALVCPDVMDVSSGVEIRPGIKDADHIVRFVAALQ